MLQTSTDWPCYVLGQDYTAEARGAWDYSTGLTHLGVEVLRHATSGTCPDVWTFAKEHLLEDLDISVTRWDHEPLTNELPQRAGETIYAGGWMLMRPRDMAGFGQFYLDEGFYGTEELISSSWVADTTAAYAACCPSGYYYSAWWRHQSLGAGGQHICVFPSLQMAVVITSDVYDAPPNGFLEQEQDNVAILLEVLDAVND